MVHRTHLLLSTVLLSGCGRGGDQDTATVTTIDGLTTRRWSAETASDGLHEVRVDVGESESAMLVCGLTPERRKYLSLERIESPDGDVALTWEDWYDVPRVLTGALFPNASDSCVNWPVRSEDGPLQAGVWSVFLAATDDDNLYSGRTALDVVAQTRKDSGSAGTLHVRVGFAGDLGDDDALVDSVASAIERWVDIWSVAGVDLEWDVLEVGMDTDLPDLISGDGAWQDAAALTDDGDILVVVGETIDGTTDLFGVSGAIPGPLVSTPRAAVAISTLANAGRDGRFDDDEIVLLGDTLAHEAGHYLGLTHPVEDGFAQWDALADTEECSDQFECEDALADNNMYPYPICSRSACAPQDVLTDDQAAVLSRYTGVR